MCKVNSTYLDGITLSKTLKSLGKSAFEKHTLKQLREKCKKRLNKIRLFFGRSKIKLSRNEKRNNKGKNVSVKTNPVIFKEELAFKQTLNPQNQTRRAAGFLMCSFELVMCCYYL